VAYGLKILAKHGEVRQDRNAWEVTIGRYVVGFIGNGGSEPDRSITCEGVRNINDHSDSRSDYCAWTFFPSLKSAIAFAQRMNAERARQESEAVA